MTNRERVLRTRARAMAVKMADEDEKLRRQAWRENAPVREASRLISDKFQDGARLRWSWVRWQWERL